MRAIYRFLIFVLVVMPRSEVASGRGLRLGDLTWKEAEKALTPEAVVVLPLGAAAKEHGPHLKLDNDAVMAERLTERMMAKAWDDLVVAPPLTYNYYPAFLEYPGSISLSLSTATNLVVESVESLARFGTRRFYVLNTGVSTQRPLALAVERLRAEGILLRYTDTLTATADVERKVRHEDGGTHADEIETSMMLALSPDRVEMKKAVRDYRPGDGPLTRDPKNAKGVYSPTGVWGDARLATREKGELLVEAFVSRVLQDLESLRKASLPTKHR